MNYEPSPMVTSIGAVLSYLARELRVLAGILKDDAPVVQYRTGPVKQESLTAAVSANYKIADGNIVLISSSATVTLTGIANIADNRELVLMNIGTGVVVLKNQASESSASFRFALTTDWQLSANASCVLWRDAMAARWRGLSRT